MDLGGFRGRTNKLVDGCYSWWVGGCFALVAGLDGGAKYPRASSNGPHPTEDAMDIDWDAVEGGNWCFFAPRPLIACR